MKAALVTLRPQMISLVEYKASFDDPYLDISSIGNQYGDIYENQLNKAMDSRLNEDPIPEWYNDVVMPMIKNAPSAKL